MCKLQNNCCCLTCKQDHSSDYTGKDPSEDRNRLKGRILTRNWNKRPNHKFQNTDSQGAWAPASTIMYFVHYKKAFDLISHDKLWVTMMDMGYPLHLIWLAGQALQDTACWGQSSGKYSIKSMVWFRVKKGVWPGCVFSPYLFNILAELVMRETLDGL